MALTASGIGSNLDVNGIVSQLMAVEQRPITQLSVKEAGFQGTLSAVGQMKSAVASIQGALGALKDASRFSGVRASTSDNTVATIAAQSSATPGNYSLNVTALAQAQKLFSKTFAASTSTVGSGTLNIQFGTASGGVFTANADRAAISITIDPTNNTLAGIRDEINKANAGVSATIVNDGSGYRLALSSQYTGASNSLKITMNDGDGNHTDDAGLSQLIYDPTGTKRLSESQAAQDATFTIDGIAVSKPTNSVTDAIDGVSLTLLKAGTSTLSVIRDSSTVRGAIESFVKTFNDANKTLTSMGAYDPETKKAGALQGDATLRAIRSQMRSLLTSALTHAGGGLTTLSDVGLSFDVSGTLKLDSSKLQSVINDPTKDISTLFAAVGKPSDSQVSFVSSSSATKIGTYPLTVSQLASQGTITASALLNGDITTGINDSIGLSVDGNLASITLAGGHYSAAGFAAELQSKLNGALASSGASVAVTATGTGASTTGTSAANLTINGTNDALSVTLNGVTHAVTLTQATYASASDLAAHVQTQINAAFVADGLAVAVSQNSGILSISAANSFGTTSTSSVAGVGADSLLGAGRVDAAGTPGALTIKSVRYGAESTLAGLLINASLVTPATIDVTAATGVNVAGAIGAGAASGKGQTLTGVGDADGLALSITGGTTGARGNVAFDRGFAVQLDDYLTQILGSKGSIAARTDGINASIKAIGERRAVIEQRLVQIEARYRRQFTALDALVGGMNQTSSYLQQQLANLPKISG